MFVPASTAEEPLGSVDSVGVRKAILLCTRLRGRAPRRAPPSRDPRAFSVARRELTYTASPRARMPMYTGRG